MQSGPSAKNSVIFSGGNSSKNYGADQQRLQILELHFHELPTPATFACWKIRFKTEVCTCSQFPTEAMQWIKEVELVDSVDELRNSSSIRCITVPNFEVLERTAEKSEDTLNASNSFTENKNVGVEQTHDRSGQPNKQNDAVQDDPEIYHEIKMLNTDNELIRGRIGEDMDFKIQGLPHSVVQHAQSTSVRELIQKIENHPNRHAF